MAFCANDEKWMRLALEQARLSAQNEEPPIGAVLVCGDELLVAAHNHRERDYDITSHAEIETLRAAGAMRRDWRMGDCTLYVTLEPCPMCAGAILAARVGRVVYAAKDPVAGAMGSVLNLPRFPLGSSPVVEHGLFADEAREMLQAFFKARREK